MVSAFTQRGADVTVRALQAGAFDFVDQTKRPLGRSQSGRAAPATHFPDPPVHGPAAGGAHRRQTAADPAWLRPSAPANGPGVAARAILVASSTGGPRALDALLPDLRRLVRLAGADRAAHAAAVHALAGREPIAARRRVGDRGDGWRADPPRNRLHRAGRQAPGASRSGRAAADGAERPAAGEPLPAVRGRDVSLGGGRARR